MDLIAGAPNTIAKVFRPIHTVWDDREVRGVKKAYRKYSRRTYKQYMQTGRIQDFNRSQRKLTNWDFD